jgi:glyoxylase-like metal-dependent hydrolase (beta-lactamase superfamily II)
MIHVLDLKFLGYDNTIAAFLIDTGDGLALIETGPHSVMSNIEAGIKAVGYDIKDVKHVFITHIHLDHAGACWAFAQNNGATIYLHPFGKRHLANPEKLMNSARMIYQDKMDELWGEMHPIPEEQLHTVEDETEIVIGNTTFKAWHTPGHAVHHIAWQVGDAVFSGDVAGVRINKEVVMPPCPPPDINVEDWVNSINTLRKINPSKIYLTHFGEITDIKEHLDSLEKRLHAWANWIKPHWEAGKKPQEVTPAFQAYVKQDLLDHGVSEAGVEQYEAANPSWMSVAGLMRYWRKKQ